MLTRDVLMQIRRLHLRARRAVEDLLGGEYQSVFKGAGIAFEEVRDYQPGDDIRTIDWNVTARMGHPFVKRFVEERELTLVLMVDISGSLAFGTQEHSKRTAAQELATLLTLCALRNHDKVGLILFSDRVEKYLPPRKGARHALRLIRELFLAQAKRPGTNVKTALDYLHRVQHRRAIVFLFSDFQDVGFERALGRAGNRHDFTAAALVDPREHELPPLGLVNVRDPETGRVLLIDTEDAAFRARYMQERRERWRQLKHTARGAGIDWLELRTDQDHQEALHRFFRLREQRFGHR
jgi:uncharacterized protein (DUF58 family)